ncbi:MAG: hypothetical protein ACOX8E_07470 [Ruminococcus sp.]
MAEILICGNTELFTEDALVSLAEECKVVLAGETSVSLHKKNIEVHKVRPTDERFHQLFDVYSFRTVFYVSGYVDGGNGLYGEQQLLEQVMNECEKSKVDKLVIFSTIDSQNFDLQYDENQELPDREYHTGRSFHADQMEAMCRYFMKRSKLCTVLLRLPYLADDINDRNFLGKIFHSIYEKKKAVFPCRKDDGIVFLTFRDLTDLMIQINDETEDESGSYCVTSGYSYTYGDLEGIFKLLCPEAEIVYENEAGIVCPFEYSKTLRRIYGFVPKENAMENMGTYYQIFLEKVIGERQDFKGKILRFLKKAGQGVFRYLELFVFFLLAELISRFTSDSVYFRFVDVRLFYIVIMGTIHGMRFGLIAAFLESLALAGDYLQIGMNGTVLFYNIENWIPFAVYFMAGSITGYVSNKKADALLYLKQEYSLLRDKYLFLNDVYHGAIRNKKEYKKQILGFKDSFGKIFDAVQKLDHELPGSIFFEGLKVLENIMENHSIAIYTLDSWQKYGRLVICSNSMLKKLTKSVRIQDYQKVFDVVKKGGVWKNTDLLPGMPMYACGILRGDSIAVLITIQEVNLDQYSMYYANIFQILCGLVQAAFLRAVEYEELAHGQIFYSDTNIVCPERLHQILNVQKAMKKEGVADYMLLRFEDRNKEKINEQLSGIVRASDVLGVDEDGNIYLMLLQMSRENLNIVGDRLESRGLKYQIVENM